MIAALSSAAIPAAQEKAAEKRRFGCCLPRLHTVSTNSSILIIKMGFYYKRTA